MDIDFSIGMSQEQRFTEEVGNNLMLNAKLDALMIFQKRILVHLTGATREELDKEELEIRNRSMELNIERLKENYGA